MVSFAQRAIDAVFRRLGEDATYAPLNGTPYPDPIRVIPQMSDATASPFGVSLATPTSAFHVRASEVPEPKEGDEILYAGVVYQINAEPMRSDPRRLVWICPAPEKG